VFVIADQCSGGLLSPTQIPDSREKIVCEPPKSAACVTQGAIRDHGHNLILNKNVDCGMSMSSIFLQKKKQENKNKNL
jgi:hypothetical protein